ncbi:GNAT family N-acetyltransferase [Amycolatopsis sp. NPDC004368]
MACAGSWRIVGAYERATGRQVGFVRAISDGVTTAYCTDLFVVDSARGHGVGHRFMHELVGPGAGLRWIGIALPAVANGFFAAVGFTGADGKHHIERSPSNRTPPAETPVHIGPPLG